MWQPTERHSFYVAVANSYNPSGELGVYGASGSSLSAQTLDLDPEENRNYEVGSQWSMTPGLQLRSAIFRTEKINQRIANSITNVLELAGKRRVEGIEFELAGSITSNWEVLSAVAFQKGRIVSANVNPGNVPLGVADIKREGKDCTIVARSMTVPLAIQAAEQVQKEFDVSVEVIDPRTIKPLDVDTIASSVKKTNRLVIAEESHAFASVGAEISHQIMETAFDYLDAPIKRVSTVEAPMPYAKNLEAAALPSVEKIVAAVKEVCYL
jgi:outer membrane receptor protein involved in Fe transport